MQHKIRLIFLMLHKKKKSAVILKTVVNQANFNAPPTLIIFLLLPLASILSYRMEAIAITSHSFHGSLEIHALLKSIFNSNYENFTILFKLYKNVRDFFTTEIFRTLTPVKERREYN